MIPKGNGGERPLGIPTIRDRVAVAEPPAAAMTPAPIEPVPRGPLEDQWGIHVCGVGPAKGRENYALEFRYKVVAQDRAALLAEGNNMNDLIDQASGTRIPLSAPLQVAWPFDPHSRARSMALAMREAGSFPPPPNRLIPGKTYSVLVPNAEGVVKSGNKVAVLIGDVRVDDITVE